MAESGSDDAPYRFFGWRARAAANTSILAAALARRYPHEDGRDLRIDFIRGVVMFVLVISHIDAFSWYAFITWERIGVVSGGEGFVILSGYVLGMVYRRRLETNGWEDAVNRLADRSFQLYRVNVAVVLLVLLFHWLPLVDAFSVMTYVNQGTGEVYRLYPAPNEPIRFWVAKILLLRCGPHQFQIMGLYVILILLTPLALWAFHQGRTGAFLGISWLFYLYNWAWPSRPTGAQFEYGFPLLAWQLTFFHGMAAGYHRDRIGAAWEKPWVRPTFWAVTIPLFLAFLFYANNNPNPRMPDFAKLSIIPPETFWKIYNDWFLKNQLGLGRLLNYAVVLALGYQLLTHCWKPINALFGWYMIPIGQASLYVFIMHIFLLMAVRNVPGLFQNGVGVTIACTVILAAEWLLVRHQVLYRWVPR